MVEMETAPLEGSGERQMVWPTPTTVQNGEVSKFTGNADGLSESVQENTGWLHLAHMAVGMDVGVAAVDFLRTFGSARRAEWFSGEVVRKC